MGKKDFWILGLALLAAIVLVLAQFTGQAAETISWGLSFPQPGQPSTGPSSRENLARYDAAYRGGGEEKVLYLTFDAGYENGCTRQVLDTLEKHDVKAAFFLAGNYMEKNPDLVRQMAQAGHIVGNHTMHHPDMSRLDQEAFIKELTQLEELYTRITGREIARYYRPPQGVYSRQSLEYAKDLGYKTVFWSLAYADWDNSNQPTRQQAFDKLLPRVHNGAVVLLHSTSTTNAAVLDELLTTWEEAGYSFGTLDQLFGQ